MDLPSELQLEIITYLDDDSKDVMMHSCSLIRELVLLTIPKVMEFNYYKLCAANKWLSILLSEYLPCYEYGFYVAYKHHAIKTAEVLLYREVKDDHPFSCDSAIKALFVHNEPRLLARLVPRSNIDRLELYMMLRVIGTPEMISTLDMHNYNDLHHILEKPPNYLLCMVPGADIPNKKDDRCLAGAILSEDPVWVRQVAAEVENICDTMIPLISHATLPVLDAMLDCYEIADTVMDYFLFRKMTKERYECVAKHMSTDASENTKLAKALIATRIGVKTDYKCATCGKTLDTDECKAWSISTIPYAHRVRDGYLLSKAFYDVENADLYLKQIEDRKYLIFNLELLIKDSNEIALAEAIINLLDEQVVIPSCPRKFKMFQAMIEYISVVPRKNKKIAINSILPANVAFGYIRDYRIPRYKSISRHCLYLLRYIHINYPEELPATMEDIEAHGTALDLETQMYIIDNNIPCKFIVRPESVKAVMKKYNMQEFCNGIFTTEFLNIIDDNIPGKFIGKA